MQNIKILIILGVTFVLFLIGFSVFKSTQAKTDSYVDEDLYDKPIIAIVATGTDNVTISAGMYRYGDITQDGKLNSMDVDFVELLIGEKLKFTDSQKLLADFNRDGIVDTIDLNMLKDYVLDHGEVKYDMNEDSLQYCAIDNDNSDNCVWYDNKTIEIHDEKLYYAFVKNKDTGKISSDYKFFFSIIKDAFIY